MRLSTLLVVGVLAGGAVGAVCFGGRTPEFRGDAADPKGDDPYEPPRHAPEQPGSA